MIDTHTPVSATPALPLPSRRQTPKHRLHGWLQTLAACLLAVCGWSAQAQAGLDDAEQLTAKAPVRVVAIGTTHAHVNWILNRQDDQHMQFVGFYEPNTELAKRQIQAHGFDPSMHFTDLNQMLDTLKPDAACLFGSIKDHRPHAIACAQRGIDVMVEKPLAVSVEDALAMAQAANENGTHLLTNYETTWYASNHEAYARAVTDGSLGTLRRIQVRMGHPGPIEIGCGPTFTDWLTDPQQNGAGALYDFGCYGANLSTWLMGDELPVSIQATTLQNKPDFYPKVDDDATITIAYKHTVAIVEASWCWTYNRKDMTVYGTKGHLTTLGRTGLAVGQQSPQTQTLQFPERQAGEGDPFRHLVDVVRGDAKPNALTSLDNNLLVVAILEAAKQSAQTGRTIPFTDPRPRK